MSCHRSRRKLLNRTCSRETRSCSPTASREPVTPLSVGWSGFTLREYQPPPKYFHTPLRRKVRLCLYARWFSLGVAVAKRPILTIICVICGNLLCGIGLVNFHQIDPWEPIWTDKNSAFMRDRDWIQERFPSKFRINSYFVEADNVLDPQTLREVKLYYKTRLNPK